jgi:hypothetical protein
MVGPSNDRQRIARTRSAAEYVDELVIGHAVIPR